METDRETVRRSARGAILDTRFLPESMKHDFAWGLDARHQELVTYPAGYIPANDTRMAQLISTARQAYALGLISYLPTWAKDY